MESNMYYVISDPDWIAHSGTIGQKWGIRLYQYKDGSYTPLGKLRYGRNGAAPSGGYTISKKKIGYFKKRKMKKNLKKARAAAKAKRISEAEKAKEAEKVKEAKKAKEAERDKLVKTGSASEIYARRNELSAEQKTEAINRLKLDESLSSLSESEKKRTVNKVDKYIKRANTVASILDTTVKLKSSYDGLKKAFGSGNDTAKQTAIRSGKTTELLKWEGKLSGSELDEAVKIMNKWNIIEKENAKQFPRIETSKTDKDKDKDKK